MSVEIEWIGRTSFDKGLQLQNELVERRSQGEIGDRVLLLEHDPVYTIGRTRDKSSLVPQEAGKENGAGALPHPVVEINRGGQATYHGPGQLVGYLILDLHNYGMDLHLYLREIESILIEFLRGVGVLEASRNEGLTGVWIHNRKIASIGVGVRKWISMHGFALNIERDLSGFDSIVPCGIQDVEMTSLEGELNQRFSIQRAANEIEPYLRSGLARLRKAKA